jgi:hypothetical protein
MARFGIGIVFKIFSRELFVSCLLRLEVVTAMAVKIAVLQNATPCSLVDVYKLF